MTEIHRQSQKSATGGPMSGIARTYKPRDEEGERLPGESVSVQIRTADLLSQLTAELTRLWDVTATRDYANCAARADVVVDGHTLVEQAPVTYLLFLEKQLNDVHTFVAGLPTLDPSETWHHDPAAGCWATAPTETTRTKKVPRNHVLAEATREHPAQVQTYTEDVVVGDWRTIKFSGAVPADTRRDLLARVERLQSAVKFAREEANTMEVSDRRVAAPVFEYLFAQS